MISPKEAPDGFTIISGGQTGIDRGALDGALAFGADCGGWCPEGRQAGDGIIPERYPLRELIGAGYRKRTRQNVVDSDATIILYFEKVVPRGGTEQTVQECVKANKPHLLIDGAETRITDAAAKILTFCEQYDAKRINFAGPGAKGLPQAHDYAQDVVEAFLALTA